METLITMTGWVGTPVDFRITKDNVSHASFRLASTPRYRRGENWVDGETTWMTVTAWRALAEHIEDSINKGEPVMAIGKIRTQNWVDNDGVVHDRMVLEATNVGHDLSLGTASFRKARKHRSVAEASFAAGGSDPDGTDGPDVEAETGYDASAPEDEDSTADNPGGIVRPSSLKGREAVSKVA